MPFLIWTFHSLPCIMSHNCISPLGTFCTLAYISLSGMSHVLTLGLASMWDVVCNGWRQKTRGRSSLRIDMAKNMSTSWYSLLYKRCMLSIGTCTLLLPWKSAPLLTSSCIPHWKNSLHGPPSSTAATSLHQCTVNQLTPTSTYLLTHTILWHTRPQQWGHWWAEPVNYHWTVWYVWQRRRELWMLWSGMATHWGSSRGTHAAVTCPVEEDQKPTRTSLTFLYISGLSETIRRILGPLDIRVVFVHTALSNGSCMLDSLAEPWGTTSVNAYGHSRKRCGCIGFGGTCKVHRPSSEPVQGQGHWQPPLCNNKAPRQGASSRVGTFSATPTPWTGKKEICLESTRLYWTSLHGLD